HVVFFFQAEDGIRDKLVTGVQTCALPIYPERACPGFTLFAPLFVESRTVYLIDLRGKVVHTWKMPYSPGLSGYLTERGTLYYNRSEERRVGKECRSKRAPCRARNETWTR